MCFPKVPEMQTTAMAPSRTAPAVQNRVQQATRLPVNVMESVLTTPLGDPNYGRSINRTVLTGALT